MKAAFTCLLCLAAAVASAQELALVKKDKKIGYLDRQGTLAIAPTFDKGESFSDGLAAVSVGGKWGYVNASGQLVIEPQFSAAKAFNSGIALVEKDKQWQYIDKSGATVQMPHSDKLYDFSPEGVAFLREGNLVGLAGAKGDVVLKPTYSEIKPFEHGVAKVRQDEKWGVVAADGKTVVAPEYDEIDISGNGTFVVRKGTAFGIIGKDSRFREVAGATKVWPFLGQETLTYARKDDKLGFVNAEGEWVVEPRFDKARAFRHGLAPVHIEKKWGYVDEKGELVIQPQYADAELFSTDGLAPVKIGRSWGFINTSGQLVIPAEYEISVALIGFLTGGDEKGFIDGVARVKHKGKWGFIDTQGKPLGGEWFDNAELFERVD